MFSRLQYISQGADVHAHWLHIQSALDGGCKWVQLRCKQLPEADVRELAIRVKKTCETFNATFIVNDNVALALEVDADGVHLGLQDMDITSARELLGNHKIIGGTANTLEHLQQRVAEGCDYIGLGPYRFTTTKEKLSPVLGLVGYRERMKALRAQNVNVPVYAIGGITLEDVEGIIDVGVYGVAVSGLITNAGNEKNIVKQLNQVLYGNLADSR